MDRRKFLIGAGSLAAGGAAAMGSGAFTSARANRNFDVSVADDTDSYLALSGVSGSPNSEYVVNDGSDGTLEIVLDDSNSTGAGGEGLNPDAVTVIDQLFKIENKGTQEVAVSISKSGDNPDKAVFPFNFSAQNPTIEQGENMADDFATGTLESGTEVTPGDDRYISLKADTSGLSPNDNILDSVTITADRTR